MKGGQRSQIAKKWISETGVNVPVIEGGYKALRQIVVKILNSVIEEQKKWIILAGRTGSGKTEILNEISDNTSVSKKEVAAVLEELGVVIERHIKKRAVGEFTLPGLLKIKSVAHPARPARKNVPNPFRPGEFMDVAKKPATTRVKVLPLKKLKEFAL